MKKISLIASAALLLASCSGGSGKESSSAGETHVDLHHRDSVLLAEGLIYYGHDPQEAAFDDMYYAFLASEKDMNKASAKALEEFKAKVAAMSDQERAFLKGVFTDYADLADMANYAYKDSEVAIPHGWIDLSAKDEKLTKIIERYTMSDGVPTGLKCSLMGNGNRKVLVFAGTDFPESWKKARQVMDFIIDAYEDVNGALREDASQFMQACYLVDELFAAGYVSKDNLEFAGHSLGGRLASEMAVQYSCPAVLFNAAGVFPDVYDSYEEARKGADENWRGYIVDIISANDPLTCAQKYMSGESDPFVSTAAKALDIDKSTMEGLLSLAGAVVDKVAGDTQVVSSIKGAASSYGNIVDEYYERDYRALGAKMPIREDMAGHGVKELAAALRARAALCE